MEQKDFTERLQNLRKRADVDRVFGAAEATELLDILIESAGGGAQPIPDIPEPPDGLAGAATVAGKTTA